MNLKALATTALLTLGALTNSTPAQAANGCYPNTASTTIDNVLLGGGTLNDGIQITRDNGTYNGTRGCWFQITGVARRYPYANPSFIRALSN